MSNELNTLSDGLLNEVKDLYSAENQLLKALPKLEKKATNQKLKAAFRSHLVETEGQVERLNKIGKLLEAKLSGKTCKAMQGLIEEGSEVIQEESENEALLDMLLIGAAQRVEHYEMAAYGTAHAMAVELGETDIAKLLAKTLEEEMKASKKLSSIAANEVLAQANLDSSTDDESMDEEQPKSRATTKANSQHQKRAGNAARVLGFAACVALANQLGSIALAETADNAVKNEAEATNYKSDNTGRNVRDRNDSRATADDQKMGGAELEVLANVRRGIVANGNLSTNAHNVKIVVENKQVILRGPVKSAEEKAWIQEATTRFAAGYTVVNQLEVSPG